MKKKNSAEESDKLMHVQDLRLRRKTLEDRKRGDARGYTMEGLRLVSLLNQLQALQAIQGLQELKPKERGKQRRYSFSNDNAERDRQRQWLTFKADWLEALLEDAIEELEALNRFEGIGGDPWAEKRVYPRRMMESPGGMTIEMEAGSGRSACKVLDFSAGGLRLALAERVDSETSIVLVSRKSGANVEGVVAWTKGENNEFQSGIKFRGSVETIEESLKDLLEE